MQDSNFSAFPPSSSQEPEDVTSLLSERFLSYVFHELRTPLTVVHSYAQIAFDKLPASPEFDNLRRIMGRMINQGEETVEMIEELLEAMRIPLNHLNLDPAEIELKQLIETTLEHLSDENRSGVQVSLIEQSLHIRVDQPRLERALITLINFIFDTQKSSDNSPQLLLSCYQNLENNRLILQLKSPGLQVSEEEQAFLFDLYRPIHREILNTDTKAGPLDIGLYVAHGIIAAHAGSLRYQSDLPGFVIELPF